MLIEGPLKGAPSRSTAWFDAVAVLRCLIGGPLWGSYWMSSMSSILDPPLPKTVCSCFGDPQTREQILYYQFPYQLFKTNSDLATKNPKTKQTHSEKHKPGGGRGGCNRAVPEKTRGNGNKSNSTGLALKVGLMDRSPKKTRGNDSKSNSTGLALKVGLMDGSLNFKSPG